MAAVYRQYSKHELDDQYNNRARVPDFQTTVDAWIERSGAATRLGNADIDIPYGSHGRHKLDIFPLSREKPARTLAFIHGGYWQALDRQVFRYPAGAVNDAGMTYVAIGYPLAPEVSVGEIVSSIRKALVWLWRNGEAHGVDPAEIHICGHSAGGHLTAMMMGTHWPALASDLPTDLVKSGCAISGLYDLEPVRLTYLNEALGMDETDAAANSPVNHPPPPEGGPLLTVVGSEESDEFKRQQADYLELLDGHGSNAVGFELPGANHFTVIEGLSDCDSLLLGSIAAMVFGDD